MKALFVGEVGPKGQPGTPFAMTAEGAASLEAARSRPERVQTGLQSLLDLDADVQVDYEARKRVATRGGRIVPEAGALFLIAKYTKDGEQQEQRLVVNGGCRVDEALATEGGAEANLLAEHDVVAYEDLDNEVSEAAYRADVETTLYLRARELSRLALAAA